MSTNINFILCRQVYFLCLLNNKLMNVEESKAEMQLNQRQQQGWTQPNGTMNKSKQMTPSLEKISNNMKPERPSRKKDSYIVQPQDNIMGPMYFNIRDPSFTQRNDPVRLPSSLHIYVVISNLVLLGWVVCIIVGYKKWLSAGWAFGVFAGLYLVYLYIVIKKTDIHYYLRNMKPIDDYQGTYDKMVKENIFFRFHIECYHMESRSNGGSVGSYQIRVVTHRATETFNPTELTDESGQIQDIQDTTSHIFINYCLRYYFTDDQSEQTFKQAYNRFLNQNRSDYEQDHSSNLEINGCEGKVSYSALGDGTKSLVMFYVFAVLGLALPFVCIFEKTVSRYEIGILKRLTF